MNSLDPLYNSIAVQSQSLFFEKGIKSVSIDDISRELLISKKTFYKYFDSKESLLMYLVTEYIREEIEAIQNIETNSVNAIDQMYQIFDYNIKNKLNLRQIFLEELQKLFPNVWKKMENHLYTFIPHQIEQNITRGIREKLYRESLDTHYVSYLYTQNVFNNINYFLKEYKYNVAEIFEMYFHYHIRGIASSEGLKYLDNYAKN